MGENDLEHLDMIRRDTFGSPEARTRWTDASGDFRLLPGRVGLRGLGGFCPHTRQQASKQEIVTLGVALVRRGWGPASTTLNAEQASKRDNHLLPFRSINHLTLTPLYNSP